LAAFDSACPIIICDRQRRGALAERQGLRRRCTGDRLPPQHLRTALAGRKGPKCPKALSTSVRGFLSTAAKKHNLHIESRKTEAGDRVYQTKIKK
jgi:hypothetical protein